MTSCFIPCHGEGELASEPEELNGVHPGLLQPNLLSMSPLIHPHLPSWAVRVLASPASHALMGIGVLVLDVLNGPFLLFPILFVLPVSLSAGFCRARWAYALSVLLPLGRFLMAMFVDAPSPPIYMGINALTRVGVLALLAFLVERTARQTRSLQEQVAGFVTMCLVAHDPTRSRMDFFRAISQATLRPRYESRHLPRRSPEGIGGPQPG